MFYNLAIIALVALLSGCASPLPDRKTMPGPSAIEVYQARREAPPPIEPALSVLPRNAINEPAAAKLPSEPLPVWNDAQVVRVEMDAYVNEKGEAFGPSVKYVVKQAGGWNIDALRNPHLSYVPTENVPPVPSKQGFMVNPMVSPTQAPAGAVPGDVRPLQPSLLQDPTKIRVSGFVERNQEHLAKALARPDEVAIFDESLGSILVPQTALAPAHQLPAAR